MDQAEIIKRFYKGELRPYQTFVSYVGHMDNMRIGYAELEVGITGGSLSCRWYDKERNFIESRWTIYKGDITEGFKELDRDWSKTWKTHEDYFQ